ncbi:hypothetical protein GGX14DRAFT_380652 [Mycena pura]|uniref:Uncharacterized protein n=1 Tax=Mycena pura TaxID=153505 RepID=A0AAD6UPR1_9AGAR|nr:hypothetical protein GGX14DRAFT_380652 [Mycena pura]
MDIDLPPPLSPEPALRPSGLPNRKRRLPKKLRDNLPDPLPPPPVIRVVSDPEPAARTPSPEPHAPPVRQWVKTTPNRHGVYKVYPNPPTRDPDASLTLRDLCQTAELNMIDKPELPWYHPFKNASVARLMHWHILGHTNSIESLNSLCNDVIGATDDDDPFRPQDIAHFSAEAELKRLDKIANEPPGEPPSGWLRGSVKIKLPSTKRRQEEADAPEVEIKNILYRPLLDVVREAFGGSPFQQYHTTPFALRWDPLYGEMYSSSTMLKAHHDINTEHPRSPEIENVVAGFMFWSDATHLANFGTASLWPLYTFFGNLSKYTRIKPSANAGYHQAYFPSVPDQVKDDYRKHYGHEMPDQVATHLKRELMHAVWGELLLTPEFLEAYFHGIDIKCGDGKIRRLFPRFLTYSADYPEK